MTSYPFVAAGPEIETLLSTLDRNRRTFAWKCGGLDEAGTRATLGPSSLTLGGLLKHLALCEDHYFTSQLHEEPMPEPWAGHPDQEELWEWTWTSAADQSPTELMALWQASVDRSRAAVDRALAEDPDLGQPVRGSDWSTTPNLRRVVVDLIEEYARHTGHADLIRESVDGLVGEDAPRD